MRLAEMTRLAVDDLDMDYEVAVVLGKGRRPRSCPFGAKTGEALDRYLRARRRHRHAQVEALWLGDRGPMTTSGIRQIITRRGRDAGVKGADSHHGMKRPADVDFVASRAAPGLTRLAPRVGLARAMATRTAGLRRYLSGLSTSTCGTAA